jgi:hypothetical protein
MKYKTGHETNQRKGSANYPQAPDTTDAAWY